MFCPHCGRCLGECTSSDDTCVEKVLIDKPKQLKKKTNVTQNEVY